MAMVQLSLRTIRTRKVTHINLIEQQCMSVCTCYMNLYCIEIAQFWISNYPPGDGGETNFWVLIQNVKYPSRYLAVTESWGQS